MQKGIIITITVIVVLVISVFVGYYIYTINDESTIDKMHEIAIVEEITDDCTNEYIEGVVSANSNEEKVSPNATLVIRKKYSKCNHITKEYAEVPYDIVNMTEGEVEKEYSDWELQSFSEKEIVIYKQIEGVCNEHYVLREKDGFVAVYSIDEKNNEIFIELTGIAVEYLTEEDLKTIKEGIFTEGKENLNSVIEDFE